MFHPLRWWYRRRAERDLIERGSAGGEPTFPGLVTQLCTQAQMRTPEYLALCESVGIDTVFRRKKWEWAYILQALREHGAIEAGKRGLGFGVGRECVVAALAREGCSITATDLVATEAEKRGWADGSQYAGALDALNSDGLCDPKEFRERVTYRHVDMNAIDADLVDYDFVWSSCAFEHLGSLEHGMRFVREAMRCLKPGGVAVHTTEFNLSTGESTIRRGTTVLYRRSDIEELAKQLEAEGHWVAPRNYHPGSGELDHHVDVPPYKWSPHLRLLVGRYPTTSIGIIVKKANAALS